MKIKIIDLLNKYLNKEKMPKKIKYGDIIWEWNGSDYEDKTKPLDNNKRYLLGRYNFNVLGSEAEIIEERPEEIEEWGEIPLKELEEKELDCQELQMYLKIAIETQNEIIKEVNLLKKEEKKDKGGSNG